MAVMFLSRAVLDELDRSSGNFRARVARVLVEAAADGAILVEVLFMSKVSLREDFLDLFQEALTEVQSEYPEFHAVPVIAATTSEEWARTTLPRCIAGSRRGLAGLNIVPAPMSNRLTGRWCVAGRNGRVTQAWASPPTRASSARCTWPKLWKFPASRDSATLSVRDRTRGCSTGSNSVAAR